MPSTLGTVPTPIRISSTATCPFVIVTDEIDDLSSSFHAHVDDPGVEMYLDAIAGQRVGKNLCGLAFFLAQELRFVLGDDDLGSQPAKGLRQFASQRAAADDQQTGGHSRQIKNSFVGQITRRRQARESRRRLGRAPVAISAFLEAQRLAVHRDRTCGPANRASPKYTSTPTNLSCSRRTCGALMRARTRRIRSIAAGKFT